jgi:Na+/H+ antiporter NhaD/arsenite permease-like protein
MLLAGILFLIVYVLFLLLPDYKTIIGIGGVAAFLVLGILSPVQALAAVDWNVLLMLAGTMGLVALFTFSGMPAHMADVLLQHTSSARMAMVLLALFAGGISAFIDNVATVLMVAPIALEIAKKLRLSPVPILIAIAVSSNLQGAATLVGDTTSLLLSSEAGMNFMDFFWYRGKPGLFWIVQLGAVLSAFVLFMLFHAEKGHVHAGEPTPVRDCFPSILMLGMIFLLAGASFFPNRPALTNGLICTGLFIVGIVYAVLHGRPQEIQKSLADIDFATLALLASIFILVGGLQASGFLDAVSQLFVKLSGGNLCALYTIVVWGSVLISAFVDNIPYVAAMLPVITGVADLLGMEPTLLYFGLLVGATLGGNLTPVGASANIAAIGILKREGYSVSARDFLRIGLPFTMCAVCTGYLLLWVIWA